jgi:hypothetical protein
LLEAMNLQDYSSPPAKMKFWNGVAWQDIDVLVVKT